MLICFIGSHFCGTTFTASNLKINTFLIHTKSPLHFRNKLGHFLENFPKMRKQKEYAFLKTLATTEVFILAHF
jgi:hypothetical protein